MRTTCNECREFYCQNCSDYHLRFKETRDHHLIDLLLKCGDQSQKRTESADEADLSSDFVENLTVTENTVLYRAQVAVEREENTTVQREQPTVTENTVLYRSQVAVDREVEKDVAAERGVVSKHDENKGTKRESSSTQGETPKPRLRHRTKYEKRDHDRLQTDRKIEQFSIKRPGDKDNAQVQGILVLSQNIIIADSHNKKIKLYDMNRVYLSSVDSKHMVFGIKAVTGNCFATCGSNDKKVRLWTLQGKLIVTEDISYDVDHNSHGIHYNGIYYCVLHRWDNAITILGTQGRQIRKIVMKEAFGKKIEFGGWDIHMDTTTHNIYLPCRGDNSGSLCLSVEGEPLWFTPLEGRLGGITEIDDTLCVSEYIAGHGLQMVSKSGEYIGKLLCQDMLKKRNPEYLYFEASERKLYFNLDNSDIVCFISV